MSSFPSTPNSPVLGKAPGGVSGGNDNQSAGLEALTPLIIIQSILEFQVPIAASRKGPNKYAKRW